MPPLPIRIPSENVFGIGSAQEFNAIALSIFREQREHNEVYSTFLTALGRPDPQRWEDIPCLPISAFKTHRVLMADAEPQVTFSSSGTTGVEQSKHHVLDSTVYERSFLKHFEMRYGPLDGLCVLGLLPSYLERGGSSLVYMVDQLIKQSGHSDSGTYLYDHDALIAVLQRQAASGGRTLLIGVTYALLDLLETHQLDFPELIVMDTGGMKGRRKEMIREEVHGLIKAGFGVDHVHSEYGMTELLSQAYSASEGRYHCPPWMQVRVRDIMDPMAFMSHGRTGGLNVIDLANVNSCAFIATDDLARSHEDGSFEVLGRFDQSDIRGCSLMV